MGSSWTNHSRHNSSPILILWIVRLKKYRMSISWSHWYWRVGWCEKIKSMKMYFPQIILGVCHKSKTRLWLKWQNMSFKSLLKWFLNFFISFKMTAHITQTQQSKLKLTKMQGGREMLTLWPWWGILDVFSLISRPPLIVFQFFYFWLSWCDLCGQFEYNKPRFYDN